MTRQLRRGAKLYQRAFSYIRHKTKLLIVATVLSILLSLTSGFALYSFLPVFNIVFKGSGTVSSVEPNTPDSSLSGISAIVGSQQKNIIDVNKIFVVVAGEGTAFSQLSRLIALIVLLSLASSILLLLVDYIFIEIQAGGTEKLRLATFNHLCNLPLSFFNHQKSGNLISRIENDIGGTIAMVAGNFSDIIKNIFLAIAYFSLLVFINAKLVLLILPVVFSIGLTSIILGYWIRHNRQRILELQADMLGILQEFLAGIKVIKGFAAEETEKRRWRSSVKAWRKLEVLNSLNKIFPLRLSEVMSMLISAVVIIAGGRAIITGALAVPQLLLFFIVLVRFQAPLSALSKIWVDIQNGMAYAERAFALLDFPHESSQMSHTVSSVAESIEFQNIYFDYGEGHVLKNISLKLPKHSITALVGPSGSGKSSIADLLLRFYDPTAGSILLDGQNIKNIDLTSYRSLFGIVTQETFLFHDTIRNNILYGAVRPASEQEMIAAAKAAHADEFIIQLPAGYNTVIGDRGVRLSGGQRQRLAIARAIIRQPHLLIFDEATSALDTQSERQVQEAINSLAQNRTTLVIAHRLSTIQNADRIYVIHEGRVVEQGTHRELLGGKGLYQDLWELQLQAT